MNIKDSIARRKELWAKVSAGGKLTADERLWLDTNPAYCESGDGTLSYDVIRLTPNEKYNIRIRFLTQNGEGKFTPVISIPCGKGGISAEEDVIDTAGRKSTASRQIIKRREAKTSLCFYGRSENKARCAHVVGILNLIFRPRLIGSER